MNPQRSDLFSDKMVLLPPIASPRLAAQRIGARRSRQRGVMLTEQGWRKLLAREVLQNRHGEWHTYELLGDRALLSPRTVSKIVGREVGVDRRTLKQFFNAFDLPLVSDDYCSASGGTKDSSYTHRESVMFILHFDL